MRPDQRAALIEASLRELLRIAAAARAHGGTSVALEDALDGALRKAWCDIERKARRLLRSEV